MERGQGSSHIPKQDCPDFSYKSGRAYCFCKANTMITWVRLCKGWKFPTFFPAKFPAVYNNATNCCPVAPYKLCCRMYYNICAIFNWPDKIRRCKCIINNKRNLVGMRNLCYFFQICHIRIRIPQSFNKYCLCILLNCLFQRIISRFCK